MAFLPNLQLSEILHANLRQRNETTTITPNYLFFRFYLQLNTNNCELIRGTRC
jgi:hypothetical protein